MSLKNKINKFLRRFNVEMHGTGYLQALAKNDFSVDEMDVFKKVFTGGELTIYDVGANRGLMINKFLNQFPSAFIHAFEPYTPLYEKLKNDFSSNPNITVNNKGISNEEAELLFNINKSVDTSSFLASKKTGLNSDSQVETTQQVKVPVITLDNYAVSKKHQQINILKLDIQGSELNALKGAQGLLQRQEVDMIFCEAYFVQQYENQPLFFDIANFLLPLGYVLQDIYHPVYGKGKIAWCDAMFIRNSLKIG